MSNRSSDLILSTQRVPLLAALAALSYVRTRDVRRPRGSRRGRKRQAEWVKADPAVFAPPSARECINVVRCDDRYFLFRLADSLLVHFLPTPTPGYPWCACAPYHTSSCTCAVGVEEIRNVHHPEQLLRSTGCIRLAI